MLGPWPAPSTLYLPLLCVCEERRPDAWAHFKVEMFKIRMQGQYGGADDKKLGRVVSDMWKQFGFRDGIMRGYWVSWTPHVFAITLTSGHRCAGDSSVCWVLRGLRNDKAGVSAPARPGLAYMGPLVIGRDWRRGLLARMLSPRCDQEPRAACESASLQRRLGQRWIHRPRIPNDPGRRWKVCRVTWVHARRLMTVALSSEVYRQA